MYTMIIKYLIVNKTIMKISLYKTIQEIKQDTIDKILPKS